MLSIYPLTSFRAVEAQPQLSSYNRSYFFHIQRKQNLGKGPAHNPCPSGNAPNRHVHDSRLPSTMSRPACIYSSNSRFRIHMAERHKIFDAHF